MGILHENISLFYKIEVSYFQWMCEILDSLTAIRYKAKLFAWVFMIIEIKNITNIILQYQMA